MTRLKCSVLGLEMRQLSTTARKNYRCHWTSLHLSTIVWETREVQDMWQITVIRVLCFVAKGLWTDKILRLSVQTKTQDQLMFPNQSHWKPGFIRKVSRSAGWSCTSLIQVRFACNIKQKSSLLWRAKNTVKSTCLERWPNQAQL